jgi:hypothetical protein
MGKGNRKNIPLNKISVWFGKSRRPTGISFGHRPGGAGQSKTASGAFFSAAGVNIAA